MSEQSQGPGWWQASDGRWYPPEQHPDHQAAGAPAYPPAAYPPAAYPPSGYAPAGYPAAGYGPSAPKPEPMALLSLIFGIVGIPLGLVCCIGIAGSIAAIVLGAVAGQRIGASDGALTGAGMAKAGLIIGIAGIVLTVGANIALRIWLN